MIYQKALAKCKHKVFVILLRHGQLSDQLFPRLTNLNISQQFILKQANLPPDQRDCFLQISLVGSEIDRNSAGIGIGRIGGLQVVSNPVSFAKRQIQSGVTRLTT